MATSNNRDRYLRGTYGISLEEWERVLKAQGGGCAGCGRKGVTRSLHTDHSHVSGIVRGILCAACNSALRKLRDDPAVAENLAKYLHAPPAVTTLGREQVAVNPPKAKRRRHHG